LDPEAVEAECAWLDREVYIGNGRPLLRTIRAQDRFRR
jgi:hypothetical protein